jgi:hypothetical protein
MEEITLSQPVDFIQKCKSTNLQACGRENRSFAQPAAQAFHLSNCAFSQAEYVLSKYVPLNGYVYRSTMVQHVLLLSNNGLYGIHAEF